MKIKKILVTCLTTTLLCSCGHYVSEKKFDSLILGMNKTDVTQMMKGKGVTRGSLFTKDGQVVEVKEYQTTSFIFFQGRVTNTYWLYFCNGILIQWGRAGDWAEAQRIVYDINFKKS